MKDFQDDGCCTTECTCSFFSLSLLKSFQKTFQTDNISILEVQHKKEKLTERLLICIDECVQDGWKQFFLAIMWKKSNGIYFYGHKLFENQGRSTTNPTCVFTNSERTSIIHLLIQNINARLDDDIEMQESLKPLAAIKAIVSRQSLKRCYKFIVPDFDETTFSRYYSTAAELFEQCNFNNPEETLQTLHLLVPGELTVLKCALARVAAAKPHSADVERLIS